MVHTPAGDREADVEQVSWLLVGRVRSGEAEGATGGNEHLAGEPVGFVLLFPTQTALTFIGGQRVLAKTMPNTLNTGRKQAHQREPPRHKFRSRVTLRMRGLK